MMAESMSFSESGGGGGFGHGPAGLRKLGALQDEHRGPEEDGGGGARVVEDGEEGFEGPVAEVVEVVAAGEDEFGAGLMKGGGELFVGFHPAIDGNAIQAVSLGGGSEGGTGGQDVDDALLNGGE